MSYSLHSITMVKFEELYEFVDRATKSRKYPENTGMSLKAALKLFDRELNNEERASIDEFRKNLDQIYQGIFSKNKDFTVSSLATYKSRVLKVLSDYEKYGTEPAKMAGWLPKKNRSLHRPFQKGRVLTSESDIVATSNDSSDMSEMHSIALALRPGVKFTVLVPSNITSAEAGVMKSVIDSLAKSN